MKYSKYIICFFAGMAAAFFLSFLNEALNPEPHDGALLFNSFAWYLSVFIAGVFTFWIGKDK
ncbi:hypothetical protein [Leptospira santarosai]|uniref:hypothetical protein n=1 Tax=Leptospira santarosai TaxID=28183 RepID=UPI0024AEAF10|nr:hypothetical protein [Leptospira santarosai]MDI7215739.1 hypothetical protein [Leptospira santarosai]